MEWVTKSPLEGELLIIAGDAPSDFESSCPLLLGGFGDLNEESTLDVLCRQDQGDVLQALIPKLMAELGGSDPKGELAKLVTGALFHAVRHDRLELLSLLVSAGADVNATYKGGFTPIALASLAGYSRLIKPLCDAGANPSKVHREGYTALFLASTNGRIEVIDELLKHGVTVDQQNSRGLTALMCACWYGCLPSVSKLISCGASFKLRGPSGNTALHLACQWGHHQVLKALLSSPEKLKAYPRFVSGLSIENQSGDTPLIVAIRYHHIAAVRALLDAGCHVGHDGGLKAMRVASAVKSSVALAELIVAGGDVTSYINSVSKQFLNPLPLDRRQFSVRVQGFMRRCMLETTDECLAIALLRVAMVEKAIHVQWALAWAVELGMKKLARFSLSCGANVNAAVNRGRSMLVTAAAKGDVGMVKFLVENGADVNACMPPVQVAQSHRDRIS